MAVVTTRQLLEAGMHFGHQTRRWNPKMRRYIYGEKRGIYVIDVRKTLEGLESAYSFVRDLASGGGTLLFVGTKRQAQGPVASYAEACGMPYVSERWLGGTLTNFTTVSSRVQKLLEYERMEIAGDFDAMPKKEALHHRRDFAKFRRNLGGIRRLGAVPDAIFIIDTNKEHIAITEARKLGVPIIALVDTNCEPDQVDYVIPGNDDAIRANALACRVMAEAVAEGRHIAEHGYVMASGGGSPADDGPGDTLGDSSGDVPGRALGEGLGQVGEPQVVAGDASPAGASGALPVEAEVEGRGGDLAGDGGAVAEESEEIAGDE